MDDHSHGVALNRRQFLSLGGAAVLGAVLYSGEFERHAVVVEEHTITLPGLAGTFDGMRIAQISDFHFEEFTEAFFVKAVVAKVNTLKPDLVVLTGDYVSRGPLPRHMAKQFGYQCAALLHSLECPLRYAVLGNHDIDVDMPAVTDALVTHGIPVLHNTYVPIERDGRRLWLAGVGDVSARLAHLESAVPRPTVRNGDPVILMAHEPDFADHVATYGGVDLVLSGHTHGGQVRFPFLPPMLLPTMGKKYVEGLFRIGNTQLYVTRGIGTVGLPVRLRCPPEITVLTLAAG